MPSCTDTTDTAIKAKPDEEKLVVAKETAAVRKKQKSYYALYTETNQIKNCMNCLRYFLSSH